MEPYNRCRECRRSRPVRGLQELRVRGEPVHHRVPVLRQPAAQARAEARPRGPGGREAAGAGRPGRRCRACAAARSPGSAPTRARTRRSRSSSRGLAGCLLWRTALVHLSPGRGRRQAERSHWWRVVTARVHLQQHRLRVRDRCRRSPCSGGCSSAATARSPVLLLFFAVGGIGGLAVTAAVVRGPGRRSAPTAPRWRCSPPGRSPTCSTSAPGGRSRAT